MNGRFQVQKAPTQQHGADAFRPAPVRILQRKCACGGTTGSSGECEACRGKREARTLQRAAALPSSFCPHPSAVPSIVHEVLRSSGQPLDGETRTFMEPRFGHDFSNVRVHTDLKAGESARALNALAYTVGRDVVFGPGHYAPDTVAGNRLLAHELTHVVQQKDVSSAPGADVREVGRQNDDYEIEANRAEAVVSGRRLQPQLRAGTDLLQRQAAPAQTHASFEDCDPALQSDLQAKHQPASQKVNRAVASLAPGWTNMSPADKSAFTQYFDPANSGDIDESFVRDVRRNFQHIHGYMRSLRFDCDPGSLTLCGTSSRWCVGGRLMWTCFGNLHVCTNAYPSASDPLKIHAIIHESVHNALLTTDRAYSGRPEFNRLRPRGGGFFGRLLNILGNLPVLGLLFRVLPGNNDTINNPDSYAGYAMQV